jgi:hypothetical protein
MNASIFSVLLGSSQLVSPAPDAQASSRALAPSAATAVPAETPPEAPAEPPADVPAADTPEPSATPPTLVRDEDAFVCHEEPPQVWRGFQIRSKDDKHSLAFGFLGQLRVQVRDVAESDTDTDVAIRLARPTLVGRLWDGRVTMRLMPEFAGATPDLLDATASVRVSEAFVVQLGQFRPWLSRGYRTGLPVQGLPGRGAIVDRFRIDRDVGVTFRGRPWDGKFEYYVGVLGGAGRNRTEMAPSPLLTARAVYVPVGSVSYTQTPYVRDVGPGSAQRHDPPDNTLGVAIGGSAYTVANRETVQVNFAGDTARTAPRRKWGASGDLVVTRGRVFAMAEGFYEHRAADDELQVPEDHGWGAYGQVGVLAWNPFLDVSLRGGVFDDQRRVAPIEPGVAAYFMGNHGKVQVSYRCDIGLEQGDSGCVAHAGTLQAQLLF